MTDDIRERLTDLEELVVLQDDRFLAASKAFESMSRTLQEALRLQQQNAEAVQSMKCTLELYVAKIEALEASLAGLKKH